MDFKTQKFLIVGLSYSGKSATEVLLSLGAECYVFDDGQSSSIASTKEHLSVIGAKTVEKETVYAVLSKVDVLVLSPGVAIDHPLAIEAKKQKKRIIGELELGYLLSKAVFVGVTGTNGKTTTCSLINEILKNSQKNCCLVGNIGIPLTSKALSMERDCIAVTEVSSFQLETVSSFSPHVAVILNITPDHLTRHYNMENYVYLKKRILRNLRESEYAVLNFDDSTVKEAGKNLKAKVLYFSLKEKVDGVYRNEGEIFYKDERIILEEEISLKGEYNVANVMASIAVTKLLGVDTKTINETLKNFKGVKHRMELVKECNGVKYINDSKSTNVDSAIKAIESVKEPTVLIVGGKDKGLTYDLLFETIKKSNVVHTVIMGEAKYKLLDSANACGYTDFTVTSNFDKAVKIAAVECPQGGCVLLSPACSSFDEFTGYEERGQRFTDIVENMS